MIPPARWLATGALLVLVASCGYRKAGLEGRVDYMDGRWDPAGPSTGVPGILVHVMPGGERQRRDIFETYMQLMEGRDPAAPDPSFVDHVISRHVPPGTIVEAAQVDPGGRFALDGLRQGDYVVFAEYTTDLGHFAWIESARLQGTRTAHVLLTYENAISILRARPRESFKNEPPPLEAIENPARLEQYLLPGP